MARPATRLTDAKIKNVQSTGKEQTLSDGGGLQLRVRVNGTKSWQFRFKDPISDKLQKLGLGTYPSLSLANARKKAQEFSELVAQGINPKSHVQIKKDEGKKALANTFEHIALMWFERKEQRVSPEHAKREWRTLEKYFLPIIGKTPISDISAPNTIDHLRPLESEGKLSTIKRLCQTVNQIMDFAVNSGYIQANPLAKINKVFAKNKVEHMPTLEPEKLGDFVNKLLSAEHVQNKTKYLIFWQLHTMTRPKEAARTRWRDIDIENKVWTIPKEEMKKRRAHTVPLTDAAIDILDRMRPLSGRAEFVFPGERDPKSHMSTYTANAVIKRSLGFKGELVAHGLRAIASTALHEQGFDSLLIEACLAHADTNEVRASYNRSDYLEQRRPIMSWWSEFIDMNTCFELRLYVQ